MNRKKDNEKRLKAKAERQSRQRKGSKMNIKASRKHQNVQGSVSNRDNDLARKTHVVNTA